MKYERENMTTIFEQFMPLVDRHYAEVAHYADVPLDIDKDVYLTNEVSGSVRTYTVRTEEGDPAGYAIFFVRKHPRHKTSVQAVQDVIFLSPQHRGIGKQFIAWCDEQLKAEGVAVVYHHVKAAHNWGPMLEKMGYELIDHVYGRRL